MKISKKSWHYRLRDWTNENIGMIFGYDEAKNLCPYFWQVILSFPLVVGWCFYHVFVLLLKLLFFVLIFPVIYVVVRIGQLWNNMTVEWKKKAIEPPTPAPVKEKHPSLFWEWLKAKKDRVCPMIEYED